MTINKVHEKVVPQEGEMRISRVMVLNFVIDQRYLEGSQSKELIPKFIRVFEEIERYSEKGNSEEKTIKSLNQ